MRLFVVELWALWCGFGLMAVAAAVNVRTLMVPNRLSLPAAIAGLVAALLVSCSVGLPSVGGGILASLAAATTGLLLLLPFYVMGGLGAGCVKMQAAFGAWVGCALAPVPAVLLVGLGTLGGLLLTVVGALAQRRAAEPEGPEDQRSRLFPAQVTLSLGTICAVAVLIVADWM
jgi:prepilin peptidase CpaA